jgi:hypothetical protein
VREWLKKLPADERKAIGDDLRTMQFGWPLGMPSAVHDIRGRSGTAARIHQEVATDTVG